MGRLADFILRDSPRTLKVFCHTGREDALRRCVEEYGIPAGKAETETLRINRNRATHYEYYTGTKWGDPHHYDLAVNTGSLGLEAACRMVEELYHGL